MKKIILLLVLIVSMTSQSQVTEIWTDYGGYWNSSSTNLNQSFPDNTHALLAFRFNNTIYSTGVDNAKLDNNNVTYTSLTVRALPIASLPLTGGDNYLVGLGQLFDGIDNGIDTSPTEPFPTITQGSEVASFLTRGPQGLDLGSCLANIPSGTSSRFNLSSGGIKTSQLNDGIPDILVSQIADPSSGGTDRLRFVDENNNVVGNAVTIDLSNNSNFPVVGTWNPDFYEFSSTSAPFINGTRDLRFFAVDLNSFGITTANAGNAVALIYEPRGTSDPAFIAFNEPSLGVASQIAVNSQPSEQNCDGTLPNPIEVQIEDSDGFAVPQSNIEITATLSTGPGDLLGTLVQTTDGTGVATFNDLEFSVGGTHTVEFSYSSLGTATTTPITFPAACTGAAIEWTGNTSSAWNNVNNWVGSQIPNANFDVFIPNGRPNYPILTADAGAKDLEMESATSITLNGRLLAINGSMTNVASGAFVDGSVSGSTLYFSSQDDPQTIPSGFISGNLSNLTVENPFGVTTNSNISLLDVFTLREGDFIIDSSSTFTFKSSANKTAVLGSVPSSSSIEGCVVIERFIPSGNRAFRYMSSPVTTTVSCGKPTIQDNLQEGVSTSQPNEINDPNPGFGTHITGSTSGANGFDATLTGNPSMFTFNGSNQSWIPIPNTDSNPLASGQSFGILVRGSRDLDLSVDNEQFGPDTRLRFTGELNTGNTNVSNLGVNSEEFSLIGNPYQAQVDLKALLESNNVTGLETNFIYVYDPTIGTRGSYVTVDLQTTNGTSSPSASEANKYLQPNQAFFVETSSSNPSVNFRETFKRVGNASLINSVFSSNSNSNGSLNTELNIDLKRNTEGENIIVDATRLVLHDYYSNEINNKDAYKFTNNDESIAIVKSSNEEDTYLSVEKRSTPEEDEIVQLSLSEYVSSEYTISVKASQLSQYVNLVDNYTGEIVEIAQNNATTEYTFTIDENIPESSNHKRFQLVFGELLSTESPRELESFKLFPNPTSDQRFSIVLPNTVSQDVNVEIYDLLGQNVYSDTFKSDSGRIDIEAQNLNSGVYLVKVNSNSGQTTKKLIVK